MSKEFTNDKGITKDMMAGQTQWKTKVVMRWHGIVKDVEWHISWHGIWWCPHDDVLIEILR